MGEIQSMLQAQVVAEDSVVGIEWVVVFVGIGGIGGGSARRVAAGGECSRGREY